MCLECDANFLNYSVSIAHVSLLHIIITLRISDHHHLIIFNILFLQDGQHK